MPHSMSASIGAATAAAAMMFAGAATAAQVKVTVTAENLAAANSVADAPLHVGFHSGVFDSFNIGGVATDTIVSVAEGGAGVNWLADFATADPSATIGTVGGVMLPGQSASLDFMVDTTQNPYFSFAAMVVPSNDFFIGNDSPTAYQLFDAAGNLQIATITVKARDIWDAGDEVFDPAAAAFVGNNDLRSPQNSVVALNFAEFAAFNGLTTAANYTFESGLAADTDVYRISFSAVPVPEPATYAMFGAGLLAFGFIARRRLAASGGVTPM
jgi:PEP-CTERM motif